MSDRTSEVGNTEEDWQIFRVLCPEICISPPPVPYYDTEDIGMSHEMATSLRSELAALQYKRDRLMSELQDTKGQLRSKEQRVLELQVETEQLREQAARQNAVVASLKKRVQELEDKERNLIISQNRAEMALQTIQRESHYHEDKVKNLEKKVRSLELECHSEEAMKEAQRKNLEELVRRLSTALGAECSEAIISTPESLIHKASELVQETSRLRSRTYDVSETLTSVEVELRNCRDALDKALTERDSLQRQATSQLLELDRLRQEKETLEMQLRVTERDLADLKEKLSLANRGLSSATNNVAVQESTICQLRDEVKEKDEKIHRILNEHRHFLESLAILLSTPSRFVEVTENSVKDHVRELVQDNKDKTAHIDSLRDKASTVTVQLGHQTELTEQRDQIIRNLQDDKSFLETRIRKLESDLAASESVREGLRRDKNTFMAFLERLARALSVEEISKEVGVDLHTETLLLRAEQLARLETDKLLDKTSTVYQLQRRIRTLKEQLQRKELHLDLLRRKMALQEENGRVRSLLETERDDANLRVKKLVKQVDRLQLQLTEERAHSHDLKNQLADAAEYKISALERGRKVEDLQKRLVESEMLRTRYNRKISLLRDQVRSANEAGEREKSLNESSLQMLRDELASVKQSLSECQRRENALLSFRASVCRILNLDTPLPDYEVISRLQKLVHAHRDFTLVSRRYDDPLLMRNSPGGSRTPLLLGASPGGTRTPRYEDSGFIDHPDLSALDDSDDINGIYNKRPIRS